MEQRNEVEGSPGTGPLASVDLDSESAASSGQQPALQFDNDSGEASMMSSVTQGEHYPDDPGSMRMPPSAIHIDGTQVEDARPRSGSKGAALKEWSAHQYKVGKQMMSEKFGRGTRTVDHQLDTRIESLKETQRKYTQLIALTTQFHTHLTNVIETQKSLAEHFAFMSVRAPELHTEFHYNAETQKQLSRNGETLLQAVYFFVTNMQTTCTKTMEDTLQTIKGYESARLTYDAYRTELEALKRQANVSVPAQAKLPHATEEFEKHKSKFERLRYDVDIKLKLLDENKVTT